MNPSVLPDYAELHCLSNFSFQRGASHPWELVERAVERGYAALALTDECSVAGVVRAHMRAKQHGLHLIMGSEFLWGGMRIVALARDLPGWGDLCEFITLARRGAPKGRYRVDDASPFELLQGCELLLAPCRSNAPDGDGMDPSSAARICQDNVAHAVSLLAPKGQRSHLWLAVELHQEPDDGLWLDTLQRISVRQGLPLVAAGDVHMHVPGRKPLQDVVTAIRAGKPVAECGWALQPNGERHLRHRMRLAGLYPPHLLAATLQVAQRCTFHLDEICYRYPLETVLPGMTARQTLAWLTWEGVRSRYPQMDEKASLRDQVQKELDLISDCGYEMYFLTVHDIVRFARSKGILCQGRGSAANSAVCYFLGITAVDPAQTRLLFERFISKVRKEPPDIDVDFEHDRREEVIQYIYTKYGEDRAAIAAVVICYRTRSALRDVGKALGVEPALVDAFAKDHHWFDEAIASDRLQELAATVGVSLSEHTAALWLELARDLKGFPRHLSQHVGGFVLTEGKLTRLVPVEPASMDERFIIQWDKDDLDEMKLLKVDVLALGMLSALRRGLDAYAALRGDRWGLAEIPREDPATYDMICKADTIGVFQIESRAQMSMLPRLRPRKLYDLVVEVAIVRPGPIQGGMVHPYLQARELQRERERNKVEGPFPLEHPQLEEALVRTLGVPIFQEQVMQIAMIAAGFDAGEADELRRSMAAWRRHGSVHRFEDRLKQGMAEREYPAEFADRIFQQMLGFGEYGFPESHAYSFAQLAYSSSWFKCHEPACFLAALLNSQPMGFYPPAQLVQDARRHGVRVLPIDVTVSGWDCTLEGDLLPVRDVAEPQPAVRLGLRLVGGLGKAAVLRVLQARGVDGLCPEAILQDMDTLAVWSDAGRAPFSSTQDLALRARLDRPDLQALASADALRSLSGHRRQQVWDAAAQLRAPPLLRETPVDEPSLALPEAPEGEEILFDYASTGLTLRRHPLALLRSRLERWRLATALQLQAIPHGRRVRACGIVTVRQRPGSANGTMFVTLEDETGPVNVIVWPALVDIWRAPLLRSRLLAVEGTWQCSAPEPAHAKTSDLSEAAPPVVVRHLVAQRFKDLTPLLGRMARALEGSRDFH